MDTDFYSISELVMCLVHWANFFFQSICSSSPENKNNEFVLLESNGYNFRQADVKEIIFRIHIIDGNVKESCLLAFQVMLRNFKLSSMNF